MHSLIHALHSGYSGAISASPRNHLRRGEGFTQYVGKSVRSRKPVAISRPARRQMGSQQSAVRSQQLTIGDRQSVSPSASPPSRSLGLSVRSDWTRGNRSTGRAAGESMPSAEGARDESNCKSSGEGWRTTGCILAPFDFLFFFFSTLLTRRQSRDPYSKIPQKALPLVADPQLLQPSAIDSSTEGGGESSVPS